MSTVSLHRRVDDYLAERHRLGFSGRTQAYALRSFAKHVQAVRHRGPLTVEVMADWARRDSHGSTDPLTWARRLKLLRTFLRWLQQFEPHTEVPDDAIFGPLPERLAPHIYSEQEIVDLLAAARRLGPAQGLRCVVYETLFGLIASTAMRSGRGRYAHQMVLRIGSTSDTRPGNSSPCFDCTLLATAKAALRFCRFDSIPIALPPARRFSPTGFLADRSRWWRRASRRTRDAASARLKTLCTM